MPYAYIKRSGVETLEAADVRRIGGSDEKILANKLHFEKKQGWEESTADEYIAAGNDALDDADQTPFEGDAKDMTDAGFRPGEYVRDDEPAEEAPASEEASEEAED